MEPSLRLNHQPYVGIGYSVVLFYRIGLFQDNFSD